MQIKFNFKRESKRMNPNKKKANDNKNRDIKSVRETSKSQLWHQALTCGKMSSTRQVSNCICSKIIL